MNGRASFPRFAVLRFVMAACVTVAGPALGSAQTSQETEFSVPVRIVPDKLSLEEELRQRSAAERHDALDLEAQQRSAIAAERAAAASETQLWVGWLQLVVSVIGALGLTITLLLTWASTKAAAAAAKAALNANQLARENFILDQRPWIKLERPIIQLAERHGPPVKPPTRKGFGSRLVEKLLAAELNGKSTITYDPAGVVCEIEALLTLEV